MPADLIASSQLCSPTSNDKWDVQAGWYGIARYVATTCRTFGDAPQRLGDLSEVLDILGLGGGK
ncbi:hypothetical protein [Streptomyces longwoodensis]|uniref:hypothetical protein n=1 Tax=Streptomyces longwoodensis TaxID=68231 RepID=UPI003255814F